MAQNNCDIEYNILFLGETGVGKSTFINAFVNYISFDSLENAENASELKCLIPTKFIFTDSESFEEKPVAFGHEDGNELHISGQSATQQCRVYKFPFNNHVIRIIDTPGMGDTRGVNQDNINFDHILQFISEYKGLHAICLLLKPNNPRLNVLFQYCIKQLLCHLSKSAAQNMQFVFTNSRSTFFSPGDTLVPLKTMLNQIKNNPPHVDIAFNKKNVFCVDNEAFRFLVALKNGITFTESQKQSYNESWTKSAKECERLIETTIKLMPHKVKDSVSINEARRLIVSVSQPIAEITQNIFENISVMRKHQIELNECADDIEKLKQKFYMPIVELEYKELKKPRTICAGPNCSKVYNVNGIDKFHYPQICHEPCTLDVPFWTMNESGIKSCKAISFFSGKCKRCKCNYKCHMHVVKCTRVIENNIVNEKVHNEIRTKEDAKREREKMIKELNERCESLSREKDTAIKLVAKFAHFLKTNAITPYNDSFKDYLEHLIENEIKLAHNGSNNKENVKNLELMMIAYEEEKRILTNPFLTSANHPITTEEILKCINDLQKLEFCGRKITEALKAQEKAINEHIIERQTMFIPLIDKKSGIV
jgi:GTPase SAR1 family protein